MLSLIISNLILLLISLVLFNGCATKRIIKRYSEETDRTTHRNTDPHFVSIEKIESSLSLGSGEVTFTFWLKVQTREVGTEFIKKKRYQNRYYLMPMTSYGLCENGWILLLQSGLFVIFWIDGPGPGAVLVPTAVDAVFGSIFALVTGGFPGGESTEKEESYYSGWMLDRSYLKVIPLKEYAVQVSIPEVSYKETYITDTDGKLQVDQKKILPVEPTRLVISCKVKDPNGTWHEGQFDISEHETAQLIAIFMN